MDIETVIARVNTILVEEFELDPDEVTPDARLREDLELDSLDGMDLIVALEKELSIRVDEKQLLTLKTVGEVQDFLRSSLEGKLSA